MLCGQMKALCAFKFLFFFEGRCETYENLPFLSNKSCFQGSTACNFEMIFERGRKKPTPKGNPVNGEHSERDTFVSRCPQSVFFFHADLIQCYPVASQRASEWGQYQGVIISLVTGLREIPWVSNLCFPISYK